MAAAIALWCTSDLPAAPYRLTDLTAATGIDGAGHALNDLGQVAGMGGPAGHSAFFWQPTSGLTGFGDFVQVPRVQALNDHGQVVGWLASLDWAGPFLWQPTTGLVNLGGFGGDWGAAWAINNAGQVVGESGDARGDSRPFLWTSATGLLDLTTRGVPLYSSPQAINDAGQIAGDYPVSGGASHAFFWDPTGGLQDLGTLGGPSSRAGAINRAGQVVGWSDTAAGAQHAFLWDPRHGMLDLGAFGGAESAALDINDAGQIVGWAADPTGARRAFLYDHGALTVLSDLTDTNGAGWTLYDASAINAAGQILGTGLIEGEIHNFVLSPADAQPNPEPGTLAAMAAGLLFLRRHRVRRD